MHAVRRELLELQAERLRLPLHVVEIPSPCPNEIYETRMADAVDHATSTGVTRMIFGDLFLTDVRQYREVMLAGTPITPSFPLWDRPTGQLARDMCAAGIRAVITCVDPRVLPPGFAGRPFDADLLADLPDDVDPCGERGEFHTFVWDGPGFTAPVEIEVGEIVERDGFVFCDVLASP
jgi:diphthamide synthase (EF-2-diphthine--ammonia ligase)